MKFNDIALDVLRERFLQRGETPENMLSRVASFVSGCTKNETKHNLEKRNGFYRMMSGGWFLPNSPTMMNAGTMRGNLSACFVLPVYDSMNSIFTAIKNTALVHKEGGGTGFNFSSIREKGSPVKGTNGVASGVMSFMKVFDAATETIKQGGVRRGANIGLLNADHGEILDFVNAKKEKLMNNFNLSVAVTDRFMNDVNSHSLEGGLFKLICENAWVCGDPGLIFLDRINRDSSVYIDAVNPCGELPLTPNESCNLGSLNLKNLVFKGDFDFQVMEKMVLAGTVFLNEVIDKNIFPIEEIGTATRQFRRIGLGVMGYADVLEMLDMGYGSDEALNFTKKLAKRFTIATQRASRKATKRGKRNTTVNAIAPTGTLSLLMNCTSGIEPLYSQDEKGRYERIAMGKKYLIQHPIKHRKTALEITPEEHIRTTAIWQNYVDNGVSKTVNMPKESTVRDVEKAYLLAWELGCKGITVYREGSHRDQVLSKCEGDSCSL
jgi:ribonucleoside-diphosphate reductase alpha chain